MRSMVETAYQPRMPVNNATAMNAARSLARIPNVTTYPPGRAEQPTCRNARAAARADHNTGESEPWLRNGNEAVMFLPSSLARNTGYPLARNTGYPDGR